MNRKEILELNNVVVGTYTTPFPAEIRPGSQHMVGVHGPGDYKLNLRMRFTINFEGGGSSEEIGEAVQIIRQNILEEVGLTIGNIITKDMVKPMVNSSADTYELEKSDITINNNSTIVKNVTVPLLLCSDNDVPICVKCMSQNYMLRIWINMGTPDSTIPYTISSGELEYEYILESDIRNGESDIRNGESDIRNGESDIWNDGECNRTICNHDFVLDSGHPFEYILYHRILDQNNNQLDTISYDLVSTGGIIQSFPDYHYDRFSGIENY
jgi:hypothetical protein